MSASDSHPHGDDRKRESERVRGVENGSGCVRLPYEDVPSKKTLRSKGCAIASLDENVNGYLGSASASVCQSVSESAILELGNASVTGQNVNGCDRGDRDCHHKQMHPLFQRTWVKVVHENVRVHDCDHHANANVPTRSLADPTSDI